MPGVTIRLAGTPWRTHRPPPARCGKRGQQVRRWLERRGRRAVRPPSQIAQRTVSPVDPSVGNAACSPQAARLGSTWPGGRVVAAATCCFTVGTDPGWVRMYEATWRGYRQHSCRNTLQGLSSKPSGAPEPASGRGRPAAAGDRRGSVRNKCTFWPNSSAAWNMTRSVFRICQTKNARSRIQWTGRRPRRSTTLRIERLHRGTPDGSTEADERPPARRPTGRQGTLAARSVAGCSPRSSAT